jgi:hypothetical protein
MAIQILPAALAPERADTAPATSARATTEKSSLARRIFERIVAAQAQRAARHIALYCSHHASQHTRHNPPQ